MKIETIKEAWESYIAAYLPNGYTEKQYKQLNETFYAGCFFIISSIAEMSCDDSNINEKKRRYYCWIYPRMYEQDSRS